MIRRLTELAPEHPTQMKATRPCHPREIVDLNRVRIGLVDVLRNTRVFRHRSPCTTRRLAHRSDKHRFDERVSDRHVPVCSRHELRTDQPTQRGYLLRGHLAGLKIPEAAAEGVHQINVLLPITDATVNGEPASVIPHPAYPEYLTRLVFGTPLAPGAQAVISMMLAGTPTCPEFNASCKRSATETVLTYAQPGMAWHFASPFESDPHTGTVSVTAPSDQIVVAGQGKPLSTEPLGDSLRWRFAFQEPTESLGLYAGVAKTVEVAGPISVRAIYQPAKHDADNVSLAANVVSQLLPVYQEQYGPLPLDEFHLITVPNHFGFGATGLLGNVFVNEIVFASTYLIEQGMAHELAHSWWGNLASASDPNESSFLNEAFAEYSAWRALEVVRGRSTRVSGMRMNAVWYMYRRPNDADVPILSPNAQDSPAFIFATYHKGALVLRMLEEAVGSSQFAAALQTFVQRGYAQTSTDKLVEDIATASGIDVSLQAKEWLRREGFPHIVISPTLSDSELSLTFDLAEDYHLHVPVRLVFADGSVIDQSVKIQRGSNVQRFDLVQRPASIEFDPEWSMVREIRPAIPSDINFDNRVDGADLIEVALRATSHLPAIRRVDGLYDPLYDINQDRIVDDKDLEAVLSAAAGP